MNILFFCWEFPPNGTGVGGYIAAMTRALVAEGHRVIVITGKAKGFSAREEGPHGSIYRCYDFHQRYDPAVTEHVLEVARREHVDWIECADHLGEGANLLAARHRPPVIVKVHSSNAIEVARRSEVLYRWQRVVIALALARNFRQLRSEYRSIGHADLVLTPSMKLAEAIRRQGLRKDDRLHTVPNPFYPVDAAPKAGGASPVILFAGRICFGKGIQYLPGILERVLKDIPDARLEIAGPDSYARGIGYLQAWLAGRLAHVANHVQFLGRLDAVGMAEAYDRARLVVIPSRWDNFPGVLLEAMIRGKPVVVTPFGGMSEMVEGTGIPVVDPASPAFAEQVVRIMRDQGERQRIGAACRARVVNEYSPDVIVEKYLETITKNLAV